MCFFKKIKRFFYIPIVFLAIILTFTTSVFAKNQISDHTFLTQLSQKFTNFHSQLNSCSRQKDFFKPQKIDYTSQTFNIDTQSYSCPSDIIKTSQDLLKHVKNNPIKELDLELLSYPIENYSKTLQSYQKLKKDDWKKTKEHTDELYKWQRYLLKFPILKFLQVSHRVFLANENLLKQNYNVAEDHLLVANRFMQQNKKEVDAHLRGDIKKIELLIDKYLVLVRREVEVKKGEANAIRKKILDVLHDIQKASVQSLI